MYVPVLRLKQGEEKAIEQLDINLKSTITPIFFVGNGNKHSLEKQIKALKTHWPYEAYYERETYNELENYEVLVSDPELKITPIYSDHNKSQRNIVAQLVQLKGSCCLRISCADINPALLQSKAQGMLNHMRISLEHTDIVLDFETIEQGRINQNLIYIGSLINAIMQMGKWRKIIYMASSLPSGVARYEKFKIIEVPHDEWTIWKKLKETFPNIIYGDYASISAEIDYDADMSKMRPAAKIRYITDCCWLLVRGEQFRKAKYTQYRKLSRIIMGDKRFGKPIKCYADEFITACADESGGTGNNTSWVTVAVNRHLTFLAHQLASQSDS